MGSCVCASITMARARFIASLSICQRETREIGGLRRDPHAVAEVPAEPVQPDRDDGVADLDTVHQHVPSPARTWNCRSS